MRWLISPSGRSLVAGVLFGMVFEVSVLVLAFDFVVILYNEIFHPKDRPENHAVRLFDLVKCEVGDEPVGERTVALFVVEQGFFYIQTRNILQTTVWLVSISQGRIWLV